MVIERMTKIKSAATGGLKYDHQLQRTIGLFIIHNIQRASPLIQTVTYRTNLCLSINIFTLKALQYLVAVVDKRISLERAQL